MVNYAFVSTGGIESCVTTRWVIIGGVGVSSGGISGGKCSKSMMQQLRLGLEEGSGSAGCMMSRNFTYR